MKADARHRIKPGYVWAGIRASGTAGDLRRMRLGLSKIRRRVLIRKPSTGAPHLRILAHLPTYVPHAFGGSEFSMQETLAFLHEQGHEARILVDNSPVDSYGVDGIEVVATNRKRVREMYRWANVVLTQGRSSVRSFMLASTSDRPTALFVRNLGDWQHLPARPDLVVFNAEWQMHAYGYAESSLVVHSPIDPTKYLTTPGDRVTLVNLNSRKGGVLFSSLVECMPDVDFLAVVGVWGDQIVPAEIPKNLLLLGPQSDMRTVYSRTRVLLVPSAWESFGRVAVEAGLSGIPIVASPNPGTIEALGDAAIYASLASLDEWGRAIRSLEDPRIFSMRSAAVKRAAFRFTGAAELLRLESALKGLAY